MGSTDKYMAWVTFKPTLTLTSSTEEAKHRPRLVMLNRVRCLIFNKRETVKAITHFTHPHAMVLLFTQQWPQTQTWTLFVEPNRISATRTRRFFVTPMKGRQFLSSYQQHRNIATRDDRKFDDTMKFCVTADNIHHCGVNTINSEVAHWSWPTLSQARTKGNCIPTSHRVLRAADITMFKIQGEIWQTQFIKGRMDIGQASLKKNANLWWAHPNRIEYDLPNLLRSKLGWRRSIQGTFNFSIASSCFSDCHRRSTVTIKYEM